MKGVDADRFYCTLIAHMSGLSTSAVFAFNLIRSPFSNFCDWATSPMVVSLLIQLTLIVWSNSALPIVSSPIMSYLEARLPALLLPWTTYYHEQQMPWTVHPYKSLQVWGYIHGKMWFPLPFTSTWRIATWPLLPISWVRINKCPSCSVQFRTVHFFWWPLSPLNFICHIIAWQ